MNATSLAVAQERLLSRPQALLVAEDWPVPSSARRARASLTAATVAARATDVSTLDARSFRAAATAKPVLAAPLPRAIDRTGALLWGTSLLLTGYQARRDPQARVPIAAGLVIGSVSRSLLTEELRVELQGACMVLHAGLVFQPALLRPGSAAKLAVDTLSGVFVGLGL